VISSPMAAKTSCDILSQAKKTINLENKLYKTEKWCQQSLCALQTNCRILYFIKVHGVFLHLDVLKIDLQTNKHHRLNTSRKTWSTQHSRQTTSRNSFETYQPSQSDKSTYMIHNHVTIMNHSWWTITRFTAYTYIKTNACAWLFNSPSSTNIST
jgi:hypothetical protein